MIDLPTSQDSNRLADWIELSLLWENLPISKSKLISLVEDEWDEDEVFVTSAMSELQRRLVLYGAVRPYRIVGNLISPQFTWRKFPEHTLSVYYSTYGAGNPDYGTRLFERITKQCTETSFSRAFPLGFPQGRSFISQLDTFAGLVKEVRGEHPAPADNDRNVDVIAYKQFDDTRDNSILMFVQCTAGKNWNDKKPPPIDTFRRYFSFSLKAVISSLAITQVVDLSDWRNAIDDYGIVLDRARLYRIISSRQFSPNAALRNSVKKWCNQKLGSK